MYVVFFCACACVHVRACSCARAHICTSLQVGSNSSVDYCQLQFDYCNGMRVNNSGHYPYRECNKISTGVSVHGIKYLFI